MKATAGNGLIGKISLLLRLYKVSRLIQSSDNLLSEDRIKRETFKYNSNRRFLLLSLEK